MYEELNKKQAEWAEVRYCKAWNNPGHDNRTCDEPVTDFTQSLDACFKWLVPKVIESGFNTHIHVESRTGRTKVVISNAFLTYMKASKEPALALCLAIEKLIDSQSSVS